MDTSENGQTRQPSNGEAQSPGPDNPLSPDGAEPGVNTEWNSPYKGSLGYYLAWGGGIGAVLGWLIALAADINWFGGLVAGAVLGACIGLYVVETKRF